MFETIFEDPIIPLTLLLALLTTILTIQFLHRIKRNRGKNIIFHILYLASASLILLFVPDTIQNVFFCPIGVLVVGTVLPIYESIVAICTIEEGDDSAWLQYWIASAAFTYATEFMDEIAERYPTLSEHWYELEFFIMLWLLLPFTDGAALIYDHFTLPYLSPLANTAKSKLEGWTGLILAAVNSGYLYVLWFTFMSLPEEARRFVVVAVGTVYPLVSSTVAITTQSSGVDDTYWLTYWTCFNLLFIVMDYLENFVGSIRGFYSLCLCGVVYLFLPMFQGADVVFRRVLVPISGQYENMLLRDAYLVRRELERKIPKDLRGSVMEKAAKIFAEKRD